MSDEHIKSKDFTDLEISWAYITCYLMQELENVKNGITIKGVKRFIHKCKIVDKTFRICYKFWKDNTSVSNAEDTLISCFVVRTDLISTNENLFNEYLSDVLNSLEYIQFGYNLDYEKIFDE